MSHDCGVARSSDNLIESRDSVMVNHGTRRVARHGMGYLPGEHAIASIRDSDLSSRGKQDAINSVPLNAARKWQIVQDHRRVANLRSIDHVYHDTLEEKLLY